MRGLAAAERDLGDQARGARQSAAHRGLFAVGELPVPVDRTPGPLDDADALGHGHEGGRRRDDARGRERQRVAREIRRGKRQEAAEAVVEDEQSVPALPHAPAAPRVDLTPEVPGALELDEAALLHAAPERQQRRVEVRGAREQQGDPAPRLRRVDQPGRVGGRPSPSSPAGCRAHLHLPAGNGDLGERTDGVDGIQESRFTAIQLGRQAQLDLEAVAQADGDQNALGQQPRRAVEHGGRAARSVSRGRSRRSRAPKARGRAGTGARRDGSARRRLRIRRGPTPAAAAAAGGASATGPGRGRAARLRGSAPAARRRRARRRRRRATPAASGVRSWRPPYAPSSGSARIWRA